MARVEAFFARCREGGATFETGPPSPSASLNDGAAGIAYTFLRLGDLDRANAWMTRARALAERDGAFHGGKLAGSLFHGRSGVRFVEARLAMSEPTLDAYLEASYDPTTYDDLTLGRAGQLVACAELLEAGAQGVNARGRELDASLYALFENERLAESTRITMLGMAHGWGGLLHALLRWRAASGTPIEPLRPYFEQLAALAEPAGRGVRFPEHNATVSDPTHHPGFCHGVAGHAMLWAFASEAFDDARFAELATRCAISAYTWTVTLGTLCCGLAGIAYGLHAAHRVTGDPVWLKRATRAATAAFDDRSGELAGDGLYFGYAGLTLAHEELASNSAAMPLVEPLRKK